MKKVKAAAIGRAKVNIANAQERHKQNYDKRFENREVFKTGDIVCWRTKEIRIGKGAREMLNIQDLTQLWRFQWKAIVP